MSLYFLLAIAFGVISGAEAAAARPVFAIAAIERRSRASRPSIRAASVRRGTPRAAKPRFRVSALLRVETLLAGVTPIRAPAL